MIVNFNTKSYSTILLAAQIIWQIKIIVDTD